MRQTQSHLDVEVRWLPFQLRPNMPAEGVAKNGVGQQNVNPRLRAAGAAVGIDFTGLTPRHPNTTEFHAVMKYAAEHGTNKQQNDLQEIMFRHYFTDGKYPDATNLRDAAIEAGLDGDKALAFAQDPTNKAAVVDEARRNSMRGVSGVPFFCFNGEDAFSGAQPPAAIVEVLARRPRPPKPRRRQAQRADGQTAGRTAGEPTPLVEADPSSGAPSMTNSATSLSSARRGSETQHGAPRVS